jgi:hypothetical protein
MSLLAATNPQKKKIEMSVPKAPKLVTIIKKTDFVFPIIFERKYKLNVKRERNVG